MFLLGTGFLAALVPALERALPFLPFSPLGLGTPGSVGELPFGAQGNEALEAAVVPALSGHVGWFLGKGGKA